MPASKARVASPPRRHVVRRADRSDLDAVDRIEQRSFARDRFPRRNLRRVLRSEASVFLIVEMDDAPAGYAMLLFREGASVARLYSIAVDPDFRGQGVAESLLSEAERAAVEWGAGRLRLEFRPSNEAAHRLYERAGFTLLERRAGYYDDGEDAIRMEKRIAPMVTGDRSAHA
jgi:ribosomal-protein-alanine acetyltransferase